MTLQSIARIPTDQGGRYIRRLCKHWGHKLAVDFDDDSGTVVFPRDARGANWPGDARLIMQAHADNLECRLETSAEGQREALKGAVERHLERFAFREGSLSYEWVDA